LETPEKINNSSAKGPKILIAPLDWGLGHATRCIPIIKELLHQKCDVWVAAAGDQKKLLHEEFPYIRFVEIPGYGIKYGKNRASTLLELLLSIPKILIRIKRENRWLRTFMARERPDAIISDNRYGLYAKGVSTVFITHQLHIMTPFGAWADSLLQRINYRKIGRFSRCWVPDLKGESSLAGSLSHPAALPDVPTSYIGILSRLEKVTPALICDLLILLSGPEPQRTIFEQLLLAQLPAFSGKIIMVRGLPGRLPEKAAACGEAAQVPEISRQGQWTIYDHLPARELNAIITGAAMTISRAGYSTVMDLMKLGKKAILVPTPGQIEQEYLGKYLSGKGLAFCAQQKGFVLKEVLQRAAEFPFSSWPGMAGSGGLLQKEVAVLLGELSQPSYLASPDFG